MTDPPPNNPKSYLEELGIKPAEPPPKKSPSPVLVAVAGLLVGAAVAAVVTVSVGERRASAVATAPVSAAPSVPAPRPSASAVPAEVALSALARAALGEPDPLKELEARKREERTAEETLAMARGRTAVLRGEIAELRRKIGLVPKVATEKSTVDAVRRSARDRSLAVDVLEMLVGLDGSAGPDLIYKVWRDQRSSDETRQLAEDLLYSRDLRAKASPALSVALDLWTVEGETPACEDVAKLLERARDQGDKRAEGPMMRLHNKRGCGKNKLLDCWPCLRTGDLLKDAGAAVRKREPPL